MSSDRDYGNEDDVIEQRTDHHHHHHRSEPEQEPQEEEEEPVPECHPDYTKYNEDSVPPAEREIQHTHKGRPDLDYDDTPVGPAPGTNYDDEP